jgi:glycogen synthase
VLGHARPAAVAPLAVGISLPAPDEVMKSQQHILQIGMGWFAEEPGGLNRMYAGLLSSLKAAGSRVRGLVAGTAAPAAGAPPELSFFERREASVLSRLRGCRRAVRTVLGSDRIDVVAAHFSLYALPALDLVQDRPFVFHFHGPWARESAAEGERGLGVTLKRMIETRVYRRADRFVTLSEAFAAMLEREHGVPRERIFVVPGGVDADHYSVVGSRDAARRHLGLPCDRPLVVAVRRLVNRVGLEGLIDAMGALRKRVPEALLLLAGTGPLAPELVARIDALGLKDHVRLLGFVSEADLPWLYRACELSVVPSVSLEGFGLTTIESLASGTPVLVTPVGGLAETVTMLDPALVLPDASVHSLTDALARALTNPGGLPSADACSRYARNHFHWPAIARRVLAVYAPEQR